MVFNDLKQLNGQIIQYYEVCGNKVTPRTAQVRYNSYNNVIILTKYDKLGRRTKPGTAIFLSHFILPNGNTTPSSTISTNKLVGESSMAKIHIWYSCRTDIYIYLQKEDAYNRAINKLREERRNVDKKMLALQKELYKK